VLDTTDLRNTGSSTFRWSQLNVKTIVCDDVATPNVLPVKFSVQNLTKSIEFSKFMNATLLKHDGFSFYQILADGNCLPLEDDCQNIGSTRASLIGVYSKFFYGVLVGLSDVTL